MTGGRIEAFLKLFCITESSYGSWQSWSVLCLCLAGAIATASSGSYFQRTNAVKSSLVCFIVSTAGLGLALLTLIAILIGCKRRRRIIDPETTHGEPTIYADPVISGRSTSIEMEDDPSESQSVDQMWMNPVFEEYDKSLYEADWNKKDNESHGEKENDTDFDERDSNYFHSSSERMAWSYKSYSEDEGYFPHSSKESNLKEAGKNSLERHRQPLSLFQKTLKYNNGQSTSSDLKEADESSLERHKEHMSMSHEELKDSGAHFLEKLMVPGNVLKHKLPIAPRNSKLGNFQVSYNRKSSRVYTNCSPNSSSSTSCFETEIISDKDLAFVRENGVQLNYENDLEVDLIDDENVAHFHESSLTSVGGTNSADSVAYKEYNSKPIIKSLNSHNYYVTPVYIKKDEELLKQFGEENDNSKYLMHHKVAKSSEQTDERQILSNSNKDLSTVVKVEDYTKSEESSIQNNTLADRNILDSNMPSEACEAINEILHSNFSHQEKVVRNRNHQSIKKFDYPYIPYPVLDEDYSKFENLERKERLKESEEFFIPRYEKRPLLDINGVPISQKELVKVITKLLISGSKDIPKNTRQCEVLE